MGDVVNLRLARKRAARREGDVKAQANRVLHGRTKAEKKAAALDEERAAKAHDAHRLEPTDER